MKLTRTIKVSEDEFYNHLEQELITSIQATTQKVISAKDIKKGLSYSKFEENSHAQVDVCVLDYKRGSFYKVSVKSLTDTITISYETTVEVDGLKLVFHQNIESFERKKHNRIMKTFSEGVYLGRMSDTIYNIQKKIIKNREQQA